MLRQYIVGGYIKLPIDLLAQSAALFCPYQYREFVGYENTTPSGYACHPSAGGELAVRYFFNSPVVSVQSQPPRST